MLERSLKDLSDAAPQGDWTLEEMPNDAGSRSNTFTSFGIEADGKTLLDTLNATGMYLEQEPDGDGGYDVWDAQGKAVIEYVLRLVQDHRASRLHDDTAISAAEARGRAARQWQPIETAPKDGEHVLVARVGVKPIRAWYQGGQWWMHGCGPNSRNSADLSGLFAPTHWMPLPTAPEPPALDVADRTEGGL